MDNFIFVFFPDCFIFFPNETLLHCVDVKGRVQACPYKQQNKENRESNRKNILVKNQVQYPWEDF